MACHACRRDGLMLLLRVDEHGVPPGAPQHDIVYSRSVVLVCPECRGSEVEIYHHDCFDNEDVFDRYDWYVLAPPATGQLVALLSACPAPLSAECGCPVHGALRASCRALPSTPTLGDHVHSARLDVTAGVPRLAT